MGLADVVPGVSGGTVALILGIYERLVAAISRVDRRLVGLVLQRRWADASEHVDLRFLACLGLGIVGGFAVMTLMLNRLLSNPVTFTLTMACFFGLILASSVLVARLVKPSSRQAVRAALCWGILGAALAFGVVLLPMPRGEATAAPSLPYLFACGAMGICAMILPGVSGAMLLLLLGVYTFLTDIPRSLVHGEEITRNLASVVVFAAGAVIGLLSFSKVLRWLLVRHHAATMAVLCGFMLGRSPRSGLFNTIQRRKSRSSNTRFWKLVGRRASLRRRWPEWSRWRRCCLSLSWITSRGGRRLRPPRNPRRRSSPELP